MPFAFVYRLIRTENFTCKNCKSKEISLYISNPDDPNCTYIKNKEDNYNNENKNGNNNNISFHSNLFLIKSYENNNEPLILKESFIMPKFKIAKKRIFYDTHNESVSSHDLGIRISFSKRASEKVLNNNNRTKHEILESEKNVNLIVDDNSNMREAPRNFINKILVNKNIN